MKQKKNRTRMERAYRRWRAIYFAAVVVWFVSILAILMTVYAS